MRVELTIFDTCEHCNGAGKKSFIHIPNKEYEPSEKELRCMSCNGKGEIIKVHNVEEIIK